MSTMSETGTAITLRKFEIYRCVESTRTFFSPAIVQRMNVVPTIQAARNPLFSSGVGRCPLTCPLSSHRLSAPMPNPVIHTGRKINLNTNVQRDEIVFILQTSVTPSKLQRTSRTMSGLTPHAPTRTTRTCHVLLRETNTPLRF